MAGYAYGSLIVRVTGDTKPLRDDTKAGATAAGQEAAKGISSSMTKGLGAIGGLGLSVGKSLATGLGVASTAAIGFGISAFSTAARVQEMDTTLKALAQTNKLNVDSLRQVVGQVKAQGIETAVAQKLTAEFVRSQLNLADATKLARVAQDAAVISGQNSTDTLEQLVHGITTQNTQVLRNAGIQVNATKAQEAYAKQLKKSTKDLTEAEKAQATLNAVIEAGSTVAGAYELALKEPGKVLRSFKRVFEDIKESIGEGLVQGFGPLILQAYEVAKAFSKAIEYGGPLSGVFDIIANSCIKLVDPITALVGRFAEWLKTLDVNTILPFLNVFERFGPAIIAVGVGLSAITTGGVLTQIPIIGGLFKTMLGPLLKLGPALLALPPPVLAVGAAIGLLLAVSPKLRSAVVDIAKAFLSALRPAFEHVAGAVKQAIPPIVNLVQTIGDGLGPVLKELVPLLAPLASIIGTVLATAFKQLGQAAGALAPIIKVFLQVLGFVLRMVVAVVAPILSVASGMIKVGAAAGTVVHPLQILVSIFRAISEAIQAVVRWIFGGSPGLIPGFSAAAAAAGPLMGVLRGLVGVFSAVAGAIKTLVSAFSSGFSAIRSVVSGAMSAARSVVTGAMSAISGAVRSGASAVLGAFTSHFGQIRGVVQGAMSQVAGLVSSGLQAAVGAARSGGAAIMSGLRSGIESAAGAVMSTISGVAGKVAGALSSALKIGSPSRLTIPMGRALVQGLGVGWDAEIDHTLAGMSADLAAPHGGASPLFGAAPSLAGLGSSGATINVYPSAGMDERQLAAAVSRELAWATAGGAR